jgi:hypothetical protein
LRYNSKVLNDAERARFWSKVERHGPDECWLWSAGRFRQGYGMFWFQRRNHYANRIAYLSEHGSIPDGLNVLHRCDNPPCCNPAHLFLGTDSDNTADMHSKGRHSFGERHWTVRQPDKVRRGAQHHFNARPETRLRGERNGRAKLTADDVHQIRQMYASGSCDKATLARLFKVSDVNVTAIVRYETWRHVA